MLYVICCMLLFFFLLNSCCEKNYETVKMKDVNENEIKKNNKTLEKLVEEKQITNYYGEKK